MNNYKTDAEGEEQIVVTKKQIEYIADWLVMDASQFHDVLSSFEDFKDPDILTEAIICAIEAWNGGAGEFNT